MFLRPGICITCFIMFIFFASGCRLGEKKDYSRPLPPGTYALRKITNPKDLPDLKKAWLSVDESLAEALDYSIAWIGSPKRKQYFPVSGISYEKAKKSINRFREIIKTSFSAEDFKKKILSTFDIYISVGCDDHGTVLFTGYFSPEFNASWAKTAQYCFPLYLRPDDLVTDWKSGKTLGKKAGKAITSYATRKEIETKKLLKGHELVFLDNKLSVYLVHVNGSAKLNMTDGKTIYVGYAGNNGHKYTSIGKLLVADKRIKPSNISFFTIREFFRKNPQLLDHYTHQNERFVFFKQYTSNNWPSGSLGFKVTAFRTIATDKSVFPAGCVTMAVTGIPSEKGSEKPFCNLMVDQDTGGAIRAAGRADIYMGTGKKAEKLAGCQREEGRLYYFFLK